jgi:hypothetical protein
MADDEGLATRVREMLGDRPGVAEQQMFGGLAFMVNGNMACGVRGEDLIVGPSRLQRGRSWLGAGGDGSSSTVG